MGALEQFVDGVKEVKVLERLIPENGQDLPAGLDYSDAINAVTRSCVVLLVSHFEGFLRTLAEEFIDAISTGQVEARRIPTALRELHTLPKLVEIGQSNNTTQRTVLLKKMGTYSALWNDASKPAPGTLSPSLVARQITNAGSQCIDDLFVFFGSADLVCDGDIDIDPDVTGEEAQTLKIRTALHDVVECRNDIAHGDVQRKPTPADLDRYLRFLTALSNRLCRKRDVLLNVVLS
jgi:RiboL-PSP-HEPN